MGFECITVDLVLSSLEAYIIHKFIDCHPPPPPPLSPAFGNSGSAAGLHVVYHARSWIPLQMHRPVLITNIGLCIICIITSCEFNHFISHKQKCNRTYSVVILSIITDQYPCIQPGHRISIVKQNRTISPNILPNIGL